MADSSKVNAKKRPASLMNFFGRAGGKQADIKEEPVEHEQAVAGAGTTNTMPKRTQHEGSHITFRNGKLGFAEKKLNLERHPAVVAAVFGFHQFVAQLKQESADRLPLQTIPAEHWPLVAMLVQERDVTLASLAKSVETQLCPVVFGEESSCNSDILASGAVEGTITQIAENVNYGVPLSDIQQHDADSPDEVPNNLSILRWEIRDAQLLPKDVQEVVLRRRRVREEARQECAQWFRTLDAEPREQILAGTLKKLRGRPPGSGAGRKGDMAAGKESTTGPVSDGQSQNISAIASPRKKQHVLRGQKSLQNFFTTEKHAPQPLQLGEPKDYYRTTFLPFNVRTDTKLYQHRVPAEFDPKLVDHAVHCPSVGSTADGNIPDKTQLLRELCKLPSPPSSSAAVRARVAPVASGGVDDDDGELHLMQLRQMPMKLIQFHGSRRPAYFGTWSKRLQRVGSRRPFVQDTAELDYEVDSDAEWEAEDEEGEDLRSDDDDDEDDDDEDDEDFDEESGFVVGDGVALSHERASMDLDGDLDTDGSDFCSDDEEIDEINPNEEVCADDMDVDDVAVVIETPAAKPAPMAKKAKSTEKHKHRPQRRRKVVPLTPVIIGLVMDGGDCLENISGDGDAGDAAAKLKALGRLAVETIGTATAMPLYVSVDPADMWEPKNGADGSAGAAEGEAAEGAGTRKGKVITDEDLCVLTNVVHGSSLGMLRLVEELKRLIPGATKAQIERLIHEHAKKEKRPPTTRSQWYVNAELVDRLRSMKLLATPTSDSADSVRAPERSVADFFGAVTNSSASTPAFEHAAKRQRTGSLECDNGAQHTPSQECAPAGIPHTTAS